MSKNQKIRFIEYWEENVKEEYKLERHNFFTYDWWFERLPLSLQEIILKVNDSSWEDDNYDSYLEELESEIKDFIFEKKHGNYEDEEVEYLFEFMGFSEINEFDDEEEDK